MGSVVDDGKVTIKGSFCLEVDLRRSYCGSVGEGEKEKEAGNDGRDGKCHLMFRLNRNFALVEIEQVCRMLQGRLL